MAHNKSYRLLIVVASGVLLLSLGALLGGCAASPSSAQPVAAVGQPAPDFALVDQDGRRVALRDLRGKAVVMDFIYTNCPPDDACPILTAKLATLQRSLRDGALSNRAVLLSITIDPERDTPEVMKDYAQRFGADLSNWHFLGGDSSQTHQLMNAYGIGHVHVEEGVFGHSAVVLVVDPEGKIRARENTQTANDDLLAMVLDVLN